MGSGLEALVRDPGFLAAADPQRLSEVLTGIDELGSPLVRAYRRALPRLRAAPGPERADILRAMALTEEPDALAELGPGTWEALWFLMDEPSPFHVELVGHEGAVHAATVTEVAGRPVAASGGADRVVRLWDVGSQTVLRELTAHTASVTVVVFGMIAGGALLASGDSDGAVWVWDAATGEPLAGFSVNHPVVDLVFTGRDLLAVAFSTKDGHVELWDPATGERVRALPHEDPVLGLASVALDDLPMLAAVDSYAVNLWDVDTGELLNTWAATDIRPDGDASCWDRFEPPLVVGVRDQRVVLGVVTRADDEDGWYPSRPDRSLVFWDVRSFAKVDRRELSNGEDSADLVAANLAAMSAPAYVATPGADGQVRVWLASDYRQRAESGEASGIALVPGKNPSLVVGDHGRFLSLRSARNGNQFGSIDGECDYDDFCCYSVAAGRVAGKPRIASSGSARGVAVWNPGNGKRVLRIEDHGGQVSLAFGEASGRSLLAIDGGIWDAATGKHVTWLRDGDFNGGGATSAAFGTAAGQPVIATVRGGVLLWDPLTGRQVRTLVRYGPGAGVAMDRLDDREVVAAGYGAEARVWDAATGDLMASLPHQQPVTCVALEGSALVTGAKDGTVLLWNIATRRRVSTLATFSSPVYAVIASTIKGALHVFAQAKNGHVIAWRVDRTD